MAETFFPGALEPFRRRVLTKQERRASPHVFFQLQLEDGGVSVHTVDQAGSPIETSYIHFEGAVRNVLLALEQIKGRQEFTINWEDRGSGIVLAEYPLLFDALRFCPNVVNAKMQPIVFHAHSAHLILDVQALEDNFFSAHVLLAYDGKESSRFVVVNEQYVWLEEDQIFPIRALGPNFQLLNWFNTRVHKTDLVLFFSLLYSHFDRFELRMPILPELEFSTEKIKAAPCLVFEKLDENQALYMRVAQQLPDLDLNVLEQFNVFRYADMNEPEGRLVVRPVDQTPFDVLIDHLSTLLRKHASKKGKEERETAFQDGNLFVIPEALAADFIYKDLPGLLTEYTVLGAEKLSGYKIRAAQPRLEVSLKHNIDFFEGSASLYFDNEEVGLLDALQQYRKNRYILLSDGTHALLNEHYVRRLERLFKKKGKQVRVSFFDFPFLEDEIGEVAADKTFSKSRALFEGFNKLDNANTKLPAIDAVMRPYQVQGFKWLDYLHENKLGGCLADDMGLGKTLQTLALLAKVYEQATQPTLIVMPRSLLFNWERETRRFAPQLKTYTFYGQNREMEQLRQAHLVFTTYATLRNGIEALKEESFYYVILDESQHIKNIQTQTNKAVSLLRSTHRLALSGTPIENNLGELYALFHFLNPSLFGTSAQFGEDYLNPIQKQGDKGATQSLRKKIYPFVLRRLKKEVLTELPDKVEQILYVPMSDAQKRLYEQRRQYFAEEVPRQIAEKGVMGAQFTIFQALNELRQIATIPEALTDGKVEGGKLELLMEQLLDLLANGHKALIFVNFLAAIESIQTKLDEEGVDYVTMTGATRNRQQLVDRFQQDPGCRVFLLTLKTGGVGLNLTAADTIFIYDPWWNVASENQAIDRAHRMGQVNKVHAYKLISEGSIEEKILQLQEMKKELFENIISADGASLKSLSEEDIAQLLAR